MKKTNSILMGRNKTPLNNPGMKLLLIPCLIAVLSLSAFKSKELSKVSPQFKSANGTTTLTDTYVWTAVEVVFTDLDGTEYQNVWVDFFDENHSPVVVSNVTLNYQLAISPSGYTENKSQLLDGNSFFLLEYYVTYYIPPGPYSTYYSYNLLPGTGYTVY
jgi:hypothetical protein